MPIHQTLARPALLAASIALLVGLSSDADAQRRAAPKGPPPVTACSDFYSFVNKDWLAANIVVAGDGTRSAFAELQALALQQQRDLLDEAMNAPQNDIQKLLGDFWASGLDEAAVEADGARPIAPLLSRIDGIRRSRDIAPAIAALHQVGIPVVFQFGAEIDPANLEHHLGYFVQGGLGMPDPAYYTRGDAETRELMTQYAQYVRNILTLAGTPEARLEADTALVLDLETRIANASQSLAEMRDPRTQYNVVETAGFARQFRRLQLADFLKAQGVDAATVSMGNPALFTELDTLVNSLKPEQWKAYLRFHIGNAMAPYLSKSFRDAEFEFQGRILRGETAQQPRQVQVLGAINRAAGPMVSREYVARYLPGPTRGRATMIAHHVRDALARGIDRNSWMSETAKLEAKDKLARTRIEIGAPERDIDFTVQPMGRGSFGSNMLIASTWHHREEMKRIGQANAGRRWDVLPQTPALAYDLAQNRLIVSAAVLQAPVLDMGVDGAGHYGAYGALVGRELSRAVDIHGKLVDRTEMVRTWWTPADDAAWLTTTDRLVPQYNAYPYPGLSGTFVNGAQTRDENAADLGGVELAWDAFVQANPEAQASGKEAFFRSWAQLWRQQSSVDTAMHAAATSIQAPGQWRANGPLSNQPAFLETFSCKAADAMTRKADDQIRIWR
ncbi:M13 family metallopeptidase [Luteimonas sp. BDR2-5]|uniref:M13 family metallopeptidase n=1 Tax=Proluteimonas luteida TaxID=2878685 RepID=UPI001E5E7F5E|nr:M13 family metallopeptidase [Luteimonas sp. BDR2-5]MCD9029715.1 M13 family metallopeptidase [Luteimonas sp. BDR2-5]